MTFQPNDSSQRSDEIALSQEQLQKIGIGLLCLVVLLSIVGYFASPIDRDGKPILLSPEVKAVEDYRRSAQSWLDQLHTLDGEIAGLLQTDNQGDLFTQSRQAQQMLQHAVELAKQVDQTQRLLPYLDITSRCMLQQWLISKLLGPECAGLARRSNREKMMAQAKLGQAQAARKTLENNAWMKIP